MSKNAVRDNAKQAMRELMGYAKTAEKKISETAVQEMLEADTLPIKSFETAPIGAHAENHRAK